MQNDQYLGAEKCIFDHIASLVSLLSSAPSSRQKRKAKSNSTSDIDFETLTRRHVEWSSARLLFYSSEVTFCVIWKLWTHSHTQNTSHNPNRFICQANFSSFSTYRSRRDLYWRMIVKCGNRFSLKVIFLIVEMDKNQPESYFTLYRIQKISES